MQPNDDTGKSPLPAGGEARAAKLDESFLAAWSDDPAGRETAARIASEYMRLAETDPQAREHFLRNEIRIRENFALLEDETATD